MASEVVESAGAVFGLLRVCAGTCELNGLAWGGGYSIGELITRRSAPRCYACMLRAAPVLVAAQHRPPVAVLLLVFAGIAAVEWAWGEGASVQWS
eukprot:COSAG01_NODE_84_length_27672_cov_60.966344_25_plen_95_part_00